MSIENELLELRAVKRAYDKNVFFNTNHDWLGQFTHSGVYAPAITLDPQYHHTTAERIAALEYLKDDQAYEMAQRAVLWCALWDDDEDVKEHARLILRLWDEQEQNI